MRRVRKIIYKIMLLLFVGLVAGLGYLGYKIHQNVETVMTFEKQVEAEVKKNKIPEYKTLALAIIYTESKGKSGDIMQSSESVYGQQEVIETPEESIAHGVKFLAEALAKAKEAGCDEWTGVQAYNYGLDYIQFVKERGGKHTTELAEEYSREVLSPLLGNDQNTKYRYYRWQALVYNGGYLYQNGGNMFYAEIVKMNRWFIVKLN